MAAHNPRPLDAPSIQNKQLDLCLKLVYAFEAFSMREIGIQYDTSIWHQVKRRPKI